ncbi:MAG: bifunctional oligoribonuclease/PAP phosphatase NrnA [Anaerolineae bacterium]|nr:bifunctional oligoribonuclease/PAP phosphatase NrnA [Anaerolineae bacterium]
MGTILSFEQTIELFRQHHKIFIAAHIMPDGDCIGSVLALMWALRRLGKTVTVACHDHVPNTFNYLPGATELKPNLPTNEELLVFLDGSAADRFGAAYDTTKFNARPVLVIDHHVTNENFAPLNFIDRSAASTAEIIYRIIRALDVPLDRDLAQCLLTGIITDTLGFRTTNTTVETFRIVTALIEAGGSIPDIIERSFNQIPLASLRLRGKVFTQATLDGIILWAEVPQRLQRELGVNMNGVSGIINQLLSVEDAKIAVLFVEKENGKIDVGLRSRVGYDVATIAARLGGGGHKQASGVLLDGPLSAARERVLAEIKKSLGTNKPRVE